MIIVVIGSISTYAYSTWSGRDESGGLTTTIGNLATITFDKGVTLSSDSLTPVLNYQDGIYTSFNINKKIDTEVYIKANLTINEIDENLMSTALKYILLKSEDNNTFESIATGDFSIIEGNEIKLLEAYEINTDITYYKLYIYIDGRQDNTNMIDKKLDVTLNIGANKEYKKEDEEQIDLNTSIIDDPNNTEDTSNAIENTTDPIEDTPIEDEKTNNLEEE